MRIYFTLLIFIAFSLKAIAGNIKGVVTDGADNSPLAGVVINITNTNKATTTDGDGNYEFTDLADGKYELVFSMITYKKVKKTVTVSGSAEQVFDIKLESENKTLQNVNVSGTRITRTENAVLMEIRKSNSIVSGISAAQISKTMDRNAADVVKRVPGVTISEDRFIVVRGLSDRYNTVWLNDASAPSSEVDKKSFSFDMVPSGLIDRILIYKTPSPELPGDFAGGMVKIFTTSMPDKNQISFGAQLSSRQRTTGTVFNHEQASKTDWLGYDDGMRALPDNTPEYINKADSVTGPLTKSFNNNWAIKQKNVGPDGRLNFAASGVLKLGKVKIGSTLGGTYSSVSTNYTLDRESWDSTELNYKYKDQQSENKRNISLLSNTAVVFGNHKIEFKNIYNQFGKSTVTIRRAVYDTANLTSDEKSYFIGYESRASYCAQLSGSHKHANDKWKYTWTGGYADLFKNTPDQRRLKYTKPFEKTDSSFVAQVVTLVNPYNGGGRLFFELYEKTYSFNHQFTYSPTLLNRTFDISAGNFIEFKSRMFNTRLLGYTLNAGGGNFLRADSLKHLPIERIFAPENVGDKKSFMLDETTNPTDKYSAVNRMQASFVSIKAPITSKLNLVGGVRYEENLQEIKGDTIYRLELVTKFLLPSANLSYNITEKSLVRVAYGKTLNRPEFREQAPFNYFDFEEKTGLYGSLATSTVNGQGGDTLSVCEIQNMDARWEWYPSQGEMVHVGAFYKQFKNPIQMVNTNPGPETKSFTYTNLSEAYSAGVEIDVRKNLSFIDGWLNTKAFQDFYLVGNAAFIKSQISLDTNNTSLEQQKKELLQNAPLVGQSPYMYNAGLFYQSEKLGLQGSALYNVYGPRLFALGTDINNLESIVEMPFAMLDLTLQKTFSKHYSINFGVQNLLDSKSQLLVDINRNSKAEASIDKPFKIYQPGRYYSVGVKVNF